MRWRCRKPPGAANAWGYASSGMRENLEGKLQTLPRSSGVYIFRDEAGDVLYVGKAKSLRSRVRSYFQRGDTRWARRSSTERVDDVEVIVTRTEAEALHLEQNLVKRHRPPFNIRLRDDKSFPYIAVTLTDEYPRVMFTRERHRRGTVYFGPYANAKKVRETLDVLNRVFRFRPCEGPRPGRHSGIPCLDFHIDRCFAPCIGAISKEGYAEVIDGVVGFLSGDTKTIQAELDRADARGRSRRALRGGGALPEPPLLDPPPRRPAGGRPARRRVGRRHRAGGRRRPRRRSGLPSPRREDDRPLRVPPRERRRRGRPVDPRGVRARVLRRITERAARGARSRPESRTSRRWPSSSASAGARASSCERRCAARSGASSSSRPRTPSSPSRRTRPSARPRAPSASPRSRSCARCSISRACPCASSASTSRTSRASRSSRR